MNFDVPGTLAISLGYAKDDPFLKKCNFILKKFQQKNLKIFFLQFCENILKSEILIQIMFA